MRRAPPAPLAVVALGLGAVLAPALSPAQSFTVDFARAGGPPLVKDKFGVYATPFTPVDELARGLPMLRELNVRDFRYEIAWGKPDAVAFDQIGGAATSPTIDFRPLDALLDGLAAQGVRPLLALSYCPVPLKSRTPWDAWKDLPNDLDAWREIQRRYAAHWATRPAPRPFYEVWNEPDMPEGQQGDKMFFRGTADDYARLYDATRAGLRAGDAEARIGGPAAAYDLAYLRPLLARAPDFASIHGYANYRAQLDGMRAALKDHPALPIFLTEYASFNEFTLDGPSTKAEAAARFLTDVPGLLDYGDVPKVYWAQWIDDVLGLVGRDGKRRALFNAFALYGMMPVDRAMVTPTLDAGVTAFASSGPEGAAIAVANPGDLERTVTLNLRGLPPGFGGPEGVEILRIDPHHASVRDDPATERLGVDERLPLRPTLTLTLPAHGSALLRMRARRRALPPPIPSGRLVQTHYRFADRTSGVQAHFDPVTMIARLSLEEEQTGKEEASARIGVDLEGLPPRFRVRLVGSRGLTVRLAFPDSGSVSESSETLLASGTRTVAVDLARLAPRTGQDRRSERRVRLTFALAGPVGSRGRVELLR